MFTAAVCRQDWLDSIDAGMSRADADERAYEDLRDDGYTHEQALNEMESF